MSADPLVTISLGNKNPVQNTWSIIVLAPALHSAMVAFAPPQMNTVIHCEVNDCAPLLFHELVLTIKLVPWTCVHWKNYILVS